VTAPILSLSGNWLSRWQLTGTFSSGNGGGSPRLENDLRSGLFQISNFDILFQTVSLDASEQDFKKHKT